MIAPSIDAFSPKNHVMSFARVTAVLRAAGLAADRITARGRSSSAPTGRSARWSARRA